MPDMLVKLYDLPDYGYLFEEFRQKGIILKKIIAPEKKRVLDWVEETFGIGWANEADKAFSNNPLSCYIAIIDKKIVGFACYNATSIGFFGPTGVEQVHRGKGIGKALLHLCMNSMKYEGFGYAIIGWVGPVAFYEKAVGAKVIEDSEGGIYKNMV